MKQNFGKKIKAIREKHGIRQNALSKNLDITPSLLNTWEKSEIPPLTAIITICEYFSISLNNFFNDEDEEVKSTTDNEYNFIKNINKSPRGQKIIEKFNQFDTENQKLIIETFDNIIELINRTSGNEEKKDYKKFLKLD